MEVHLGSLSGRLGLCLRSAHDEEVVARIWDRDHRLWAAEAEGIADRLGWLDSWRLADTEVSAIEDIIRGARVAGLDRALLLGMGGSSLAPELFARSVGPGPDGLPLQVLDSTCPSTLARLRDGLDLDRCLILVASKSGGTVETLSLARFFHAALSERHGPDRAGRQFVAITDPGSGLERLARMHGFAGIVPGRPDVGGRFAALSPFGLMPARWLGLDLEGMQEHAALAVEMSRRPLPLREAAAYGADENQPALLGAILGELALAGRDKLTLWISPNLPGLADWIEQLIAESTGKSGNGILPIVGEPVMSAERYGNDRCFVQVCLGTASRDEDLARQALIGAGQPVVRLRLRDREDLTAHLFLWEFATAVAAWRLGVNPFDQPDVEAAKLQARDIVSRLQASAGSGSEQAGRIDEGSATGEDPIDSAASLLDFLDAESANARYIAIQAWLPPHADLDRALEAVRSRLGAATGLAVSLAYGPRYLHSTGQLHKGDAGRGLFIPLGAEPQAGLAIPDAFGSADSSLDFAQLFQAQALGDAAALKAAGRAVHPIQFSSDPVSGLATLCQALDAWLPSAALPSGLNR